MLGTEVNWFQMCHFITFRIQIALALVPQLLLDDACNFFLLIITYFLNLFIFLNEILLRLGCGGWTTQFKELSFENVKYRTLHRWNWDAVNSNFCLLTIRNIIKLKNVFITRSIKTWMVL